eukprot:1161986-Pelagomonas_calceolata.AAC.8
MNAANHTHPDGVQVDTLLHEEHHFDTLVHESGLVCLQAPFASAKLPLSAERVSSATDQPESRAVGHP